MRTRTAGRVALAAALAGTVLACAEDTMGGAPCEISMPKGEMPDFEMLVGDTVKTSLKDYFYRSYCIDFFLEYEYWEWDLFAARSADPAAVAVSVTDALLKTVALDVADSVRVEVRAIDHYSGQPDTAAVDHEFLVRVRPRP